MHTLPVSHFEGFFRNAVAGHSEHLAHVWELMAYSPTVDIAPPGPGTGHQIRPLTDRVWLHRWEGPDGRAHFDAIPWEEAMRQTAILHPIELEGTASDEPSRILTVARR